MDKGRFYSALAAADFLAPRTRQAAAMAELETLRGRVEFPCILKPTNSTAFRQHFNVKAKRFEDFDSLRVYAVQVAEASFAFLVQKYLPAGADPLPGLVRSMDIRGFQAREKTLNRQER